MKQEEVDSVIITAEFTLKAEDEATKNITKEAEEETKQMRKRFAESTKNIIEEAEEDKETILELKLNEGSNEIIVNILYV